jgi:hypothetical protein
VASFSFGVGPLAHPTSKTLIATMPSAAVKAQILWRTPFSAFRIHASRRIEYLT